MIIYTRECPRCGKSAEVGESGSYFYCHYCLSSGLYKEVCINHHAEDNLDQPICKKEI